MTIVHCRIDDRLIHGQVTTAWCRPLPLNRIVVADDAAATDPLQTTLLTMAAPSGILVSVLSLAQAVHYLTTAPGQREGVFLLVRTPRDLLTLLEAGLLLGVGAGAGHRCPGQRSDDHSDAYPCRASRPAGVAPR